MFVLLVLSLLVNALLIGGAAAFVVKRGGWSFVKAKLGVVRDAADERGSHWRQRVTTFEHAPIQPNAIVFVGDSLTEFGPWNELLGRTDVHNRGIAGDTVEGTLARIEPVIAARPRMIFLTIGTNNVLGGAEAPAVSAAQEALIKRIRQGTPGTRLVVVSLPPVHLHANGPRHNAVIREVNARGKAIAEAHGAEFLDVFPRFWGGEGMGDAFTHDGLHLTGEGYRTWVEAIRPYLD